ncbi:[Fe-Fe] hydrogenase large subunit C-terminal domain-containing protein [Anaerotalea alkaliphila]|uniref:PAS sensor protein n=1 Tax=Anaerotalea alkaliphila TaxID=2662126 RepID=A0A7X5KPB1_9FIRM|nr:[Fe-Fe] hydrogenase large subunit C-terminal domain-containing protein [Anaerotalea alkaliphila]NDL67817.1 PAS sensor protein [Anaerotalea alkaliphila]
MNTRLRLMDFSAADCRNCYKCVRHCAVKAIKVVDDQATIDVERCVACGQCLIVCPQNARNIVSDLEEVRGWLERGERVAASVAPSHLASYPDPDRFVGQLLAAGFETVQETAAGAERVLGEYQRLLDGREGGVLVTSCCPTVNLYVEKYHPQHIGTLFPVVSPMVAHALQIKEELGREVRVVFIGPCVSKKSEAQYYKENGVLDGVLTFEEIHGWLGGLEPVADGARRRTAGAAGRRFPGEMGILSGLAPPQGTTWMPIRVSGLDQCKELFETLDLERGEDPDGWGKVLRVVEANACVDGCVGGPAGNPDCPRTAANKMRLALAVEGTQRMEAADETAGKKTALAGGIPAIPPGALERNFLPKPFFRRRFSEEDLAGALEQMGKFSPRDELNCGACGYDTCRDKARSVAEGMSHPEMCVPNMRSKAERVSNMLFEFTPNMVFILDNSGRILDLNPIAARTFHTDVLLAKGRHIGEWLEEEDILRRRKVFYRKFGVAVQQTSVHLHQQGIHILIMADTTQEEERSVKMGILQENTLETAQKVIDKQMRVAQEIASLLGETTAETKVALTKLQKLVRGGEGGHGNLR